LFENTISLSTDAGKKLTFFTSSVEIILLQRYNIGRGFLILLKKYNLNK